MSETDEILMPVRAALVRTGSIILWRNNTGVAVYERARVRYGLGLGSADLVGLLVPSGRFVAFEVKTATGRLGKEQRLWLEAVRRGGGAAFVVRSVDDALAALDRAIRGDSE